MRLLSIASGSSGNCIYVGSDATHILIDAGISAKRIEEGLNRLELTGRDLDGIFITHEHADHIGGLGVLMRKYQVPVYATRGTIRAMLENKALGKIEESLFRVVDADCKTIVKDMTVNPMRISHDAAEPVAYRVGYGSKRAAVCTDLGVYNDYTIESLRDMNVVLLEANHDIHMLQVGPYPYYLKQRILSDRGHLSNENAGRLLNRLLHDGLHTILLGHLSKENNLPELAYEAVRMEITLGDNPYRAEDFNIQVAKRSCPSEIISI